MVRLPGILSLACRSGWHRHGHDYVVVPLMDGKLKIVDAGGENIAEMRKGVPYFRSEGVERFIARAQELERKHGARFAPPAGLREWK